jgi:hypothetical protein
MTNVKTFTEIIEQLKQDLDHTNSFIEAMPKKDWNDMTKDEQHTLVVWENRKERLQAALQAMKEVRLGDTFLTK